ncbi:unnamed protein product, partial [marine sediment metagenome]
TRLIHDAARANPNMQRIELLARHTAEAGANGNTDFVIQEALELARTRTDQAGEWSAQVFNRRLNRRLPENIGDDSTWEQMHREYLMENPGINPELYDAVRETDIGSVETRISEHLDHLDFNEAYALARQYELDIDFNGQTEAIGGPPRAATPSWVGGEAELIPLESTDQVPAEAAEWAASRNMDVDAVRVDFDTQMDEALATAREAREARGLTSSFDSSTV